MSDSLFVSLIILFNSTLSFSNDFEGQYYGDKFDLREGLIEEDFVIPENFQDYLGDIVISFPQACRQSIENHISNSLQNERRKICK